MFIASWIVFLAEPVRYSFDVNNEHFVDMFAVRGAARRLHLRTLTTRLVVISQLASKFVWSYTWAAIVGLLGFLKIFQWVSKSPLSASVLCLIDWACVFVCAAGSLASART